MDLASTIRSVPDFPVEGILFYDITTMLKTLRP
jgi:adenine/guanine phosphoribosyltransferase-like PRPP-binding protein